MSTALTWTRGKVETTYHMGGTPQTVEHTTHTTRITSTTFRVKKVDDVWFIETSKDSAPFASPNRGGYPMFARTLRDAKATVQGIADRVEAQVAKINAKAV
jgi:hypothetical protein